MSYERQGLGVRFFKREALTWIGINIGFRIDFSRRNQNSENDGNIPFRLRCNTTSLKTPLPPTLLLGPGRGRL